MSSEKRKRAEDDDAPPDQPQVDISGTLRRGQLVFAEWNDKLCTELFMFVDTVLEPPLLKLLSLESKRQLIEYSRLGVKGRPSGQPRVLQSLGYEGPHI